MLNANYLRALLAEEGIGEYLPIAFDRICMHEFVLSGRGAKQKLGIKTLDIAKRLLDHRVHPPTVYFPLLVDEALMVEPTETETKETLDRFAEVIRAILEEAKQDPRDRAQRARTRRRCGASTRPARRAGRWCASRAAAMPPRRPGASGSCYARRALVRVASGQATSGEPICTHGTRSGDGRLTGEGLRKTAQRDQLSALLRPALSGVSAVGFLLLIAPSNGCSCRGVAVRERGRPTAWATRRSAR